MNPARPPVRAALLTVLVLAAAAFGPLRPDEQPPVPLFGTLQTDPERAAEEYAHGLRVAHLQVAWDRFEPERGVYDEAYARQVRERLASFRDAGLRVEAGLGLNHPPAWLADAHPESVWRNQYGERSTNTPNLVFSAPVRAEVAAYVRQVDERIGLDDVWALRLGTDENGEFGYPRPLPDGRDGGAFWAYDQQAQAASPYPGWRPGEHSYRGASFTERQVRRWYDWYLGSLADAVNWQIELYTGLGHRGPLKLLVPGAGFYPADRDAAVATYLDGRGDGARLIGQGVGFFATLGLVEHRDQVQITTTALVDGTGRPTDNGCAPGDSGAVGSAPDATVRTWSSARWVVAVARAEGFRHLSGESAGPQVAAYRPGVMAAAFRQLGTCGLEGLMWAFDQQLYDGTLGSSLDTYSELIKGWSVGR
ncbi:beta-galactosidase [Streptomyces sp. NBC_01216]|uniref:beta-galactosidase n=1 Tax=Streptomyces sp. NBC_01216 TaxID=2903778 RepID=UPI002E0D4888|nr:beta-galactosidase [Streptomyces sp. NBC_01216]